MIVRILIKIIKPMLATIIILNQLGFHIPGIMS